jgi:hypothetical protein
MPTSPAKSARLFVTLPVDACRHLVVEIRPGGDGESDMVISHFENARQLGRSVEVPPAKTSRIAAFTETVRRAIAAHAAP